MTNPGTGAAAESLREECLKQLRFWGPHTADELAARLSLPAGSVRLRLTDLKRARLIQPTDRPRPNPAGGFETVLRVIL